MITRKARHQTPKLQLNSLGQPECLEQRLLLYSPNGGVWPHPELITVSLMPDGTSMGGAPSELFKTMNARWATGTWQKELLRSLQSYAAYANLNFSVVPDDGSPFGSSGWSGNDNNVQGDSSFGDIRIGAYDLGSYLGIGLLPPDVNQDSTAGDFFLNTKKTWNIGSTYDLHTVAAHEAGHSLGLGHTTVSSAVLYESYNGVKSSLKSDDIAGIQALYGVRQHDPLDQAAANNSRSTSVLLSPHFDNDLQINLTGLDITSTSDDDWYKIVVPTNAAGTMTVQMQSAGFSLLAPKLSLYNSGGSLLKSVSGAYHSAVSIVRSVSPGQTYYIKADGAETSVFGTGAYALQINAGYASSPELSGPNTATAATGGGGAYGGQTEEDSSSGLLGGMLGATVELASSLLSPLQILEGLIESGRAEAYSESAHHHAGPLHQDSESEEPGQQTHAIDHTLETPQGRPRDRFAAGDSILVVPAGLFQSWETYVSSDRTPDDEHHPAAVDRVFDLDPVDVVRPGYALVCDLLR